MHDRFTSGLVSGTLAGIVYAAWSLTSRFILQWTNKSVAGFGALLSFNQPPESLFEHIWGTIVALGISAGLGAIFAYLILTISSEKLYLKAVVYSTAAWFLLNDVIVPRISVTTEAPFTLGTVTSASIGSILYGMALAHTFRHFALKG